MKKVLASSLSLLLVLGLILSIWACFAPGFMSYDSMVQYKSALDQHYVDSHPPMMSYIWHLCMFLIPGPQSLLYFHLTLLALGITMWQLNLKNVFWGMSIPILFFLPWIANFSGVLWKDVGMAFSLLVATGLLFSRNKKYWKCFAAALFLIYALGVRYNAILAVVPVLFFSFKYYFPKARFWNATLATVLLSVALLAAVSAITYGFIKAERKHLETFLMGDDIAQISAKTNQNLLPWVKHDDLLVCSVPPILYERAMCFISKGYDPSGSLVVDVPYESTYALWEKTVVAHPFVYASIRIEAFLYFLRPPLAQPGFTWFLGITRNDFGIRMSHPEAAGVLERYMVLTNETVLSELFKPYIWLMLAVITFIWASRLSASIEKTHILVLNASSLGCFLSLLIAVPSVDFRYVYWCVIATSLSIIILASTYQRFSPNGSTADVL
jgi:hypothetical protein